MLPDLLNPISTLARRCVAALVATSLLLTSWPLPAQTVDGAAEARALAPGLTPNAGTMFQLEDGTVILEGGGEIPLEQLFPGEGDATPLTDAHGDEGAMVDLGHAAQQQLLNAPTGEGEAYRTLLDSPYDGPRDLSRESWFDHTRTILGDIERLGGELGRCVPTQVVGSKPRAVWQPDLRVCTRPAQAPITDACRIEHSLSFSEQSALARVGVYGAEINTFRLDFANGSWTQIAPADGSHFAGEVPQLDQEALCGGAVSMHFTLTAAGTWAEAPVPGDLDDSIVITVLQQPSCTNGLQAVVQLTDPGGNEKNKSGSELALHILGVTDQWWPQACLDLALGQELPAACTITASALGPPDQEGCAYHDGWRICEGDPLWQAISPPPFDPEETRLSRLAGGADIHWSCPAGTATVPIADSCGPLQERPECTLQSTSCVAGTENADGTCTVVEDSYDCGREVVIDDGGIRTELQCDGEITCLGDSCTGGTQETNPNFAQVAAVLKGAELAALDGACNPETGECAVFTGETASCKRVLAGTVDCCQDVQGVSLASYLELAFAVASLSGAMATLDPTSPLRGGWEFMASPLAMSWDWIGGQFTSALNGITGSTTPAASAGESLGILGAAQQQLMRATAQWTLETFGATAANALFTVNGGAAIAADGTLAAGTVQLGGAAAAVGTVLYWVGIAYAVYQIAIILAQIIWECEEDELQLAVRRELKQCTSLGSYCASDTPAGCLVSKRSYCCYSSPFSRIVQEQVRPQLGLSMGDAQAPDCSGIPIQDLARIDWAKVDLDEWIGMLAANGQLPDAESITVERLTGSLRAIDAGAGQAPAAATARAAAATPMAASAAVPGGTGRRPDVIERTLARTTQSDVPGALASARDELMPYLRPGGGAPKPRPEAYDREDIPPELLAPWRLPNRWMDQLPPDGGGPIVPLPPYDPDDFNGCAAEATQSRALCYPGTGTDVPVAGPDELQRALDAARPGDHLRLAPGIYGGTYRYTRSGTAAAPIVIKPAGGTVTLTGLLHLDGSYGVLAGIEISQGRLTMNGHHNRITRNRFDRPSTPVIEMNGGVHACNRIDHNEIAYFAGFGIEINAGGNAALHQGHRIDHNHIHDHHVGGSEEVMRMLTDSFNPSHLLYEYNLLERVLQGPRVQSEVISLKTAATTVRWNTILASGKVNITARETNGSRIEHNFLGDGAGIRLFGDDNIARGNQLDGGTIEVRAGDGTMDDTHPGCPKTGLTAVLPNCKSAHTAARRTIVADNQARIAVGIAYGGDTVPAQDTVLQHNAGPIVLNNPYHLRTSHSEGTPAAKAVRLSPQQVGIGAPDPSCL